MSAVSASNDYAIQMYDLFLQLSKRSSFFLIFIKFSGCVNDRPLSWAKAKNSTWNCYRTSLLHTQRPQVVFKECKAANILLDFVCASDMLFFYDKFIISSF